MNLPRQEGPLRRALLAQGTDNCILWAGAISAKGYGAAGDRHRRTTAHRRVWEWIHGETPLPLDHLCSVRLCVNIRHLEPVTTAVNNERARDRRQAWPAATHCKNGHRWTPETTYTRPSGTRKCIECARSPKSVEAELVLFDLAS